MEVYKHCSADLLLRIFAVGTQETSNDLNLGLDPSPIGRSSIPKQTAEKAALTAEHNSFRIHDKDMCGTRSFDKTASDSRSIGVGQ